LGPRTEIPDTFFITCSDSRVVPDLLAEASAIEYSVASQIVRLGELTAAAGGTRLPTFLITNEASVDTPNLARWLHHAHTASFRLEHEGALDDSLKQHDQLSQLNVLVQLEHLMSYPVVRTRVLAGTLHLSGWWFDIASGSMYAYERGSRRFEIIDRSLADRLIARLAAPR
jgi:carbonic anhydrase